MRALLFGGMQRSISHIPNNVNSEAVPTKLVLTYIKKSPLICIIILYVYYWLLEGNKGVMLDDMKIELGTQFKINYLGKLTEFLTIKTSHYHAKCANRLE